MRQLDGERSRTFTPRQLATGCQTPTRLEARVSGFQDDGQVAVGDSMRILLVHNFYQQPGGEDAVFATEGQLLKACGHHVTRYSLDNRRIDRMGPVSMAAATLWNRRSVRELTTLIEDAKPDIAHFHNTFPLVSPAGYFVAQAADVAVVQTLHNYRLLCANALLFRSGGTCRDCVGKRLGWPGILHACYRNSRAASAGVVAMQTVHGAIRTWARKVDAYIALTRFARDQFVTGGLPADKVHIKPNFIPDPGRGDGSGGNALFVGRLSKEKGLETLLDAWATLPRQWYLKVIGDGPLMDRARQVAALIPRLELLGRLSSDEVLDAIGRARFVIVPSECYEGALPRVAIEAFAKGTPVLASDVGSLSEGVEHGRTGFLYQAGDAKALAQRARQLFEKPALAGGMRRYARAEYEARYTAEANYAILMQVYEQARLRSGF
jgi:glycosyltransferase involved in cell wall biosynthesis